MPGRSIPVFRLSGLGEVEDRGGGGTEVDLNCLGVVGVDRQVGGGQVGLKLDGAAEGVVQGATAEDLVGVELELGAGLDALQHVLDHPVAQGVVGVGEVHRGAAGTVGETCDEGLEGDVLTRRVADGGNVDLVTGYLEAPLADLSHSGEGCILDLELVGGGCRSSVRDGDGGAAGRGGNLHGTGGGGVGDHVVGRTTRDAARQGAGAGAAVSGVDDTEHHRVANLKVQVGGDSKGVGA